MKRWDFSAYNYKYNFSINQKYKISANHQQPNALYAVLAPVIF